MKGRQRRPSHQRLSPQNSSVVTLWVLTVGLRSSSCELVYKDSVTPQDMSPVMPKEKHWRWPTRDLSCRDPLLHSPSWRKVAFPCVLAQLLEHVPDCGTGPPLHDGPQHLLVSPWTICLSSSWGNRGSSCSREITVHMSPFLSFTFAIRSSQGCWVQKMPAGWRSML